VLVTLRRCAEEGSVIKRNHHNLKVVKDTLLECSPEYSVLLGMIVYAADVGDLYDLGDTEYVEVTDPYLYLGNPFAGTGWVGDEPLKGTIRIKRSDLTTDSGAFGYGWNDVTGGVTVSAYEATVTAVPKDHDTKEGAA
jgi:hypothetical protein